MPLTRVSRSSLRVAVVTETFPPEVNGVAVTIAQIVTGLRDRDHDVQLVRPRRSQADVGDTDGPSVLLTNALRIPRYPHLRLGLPSRRALASAWTRERPDVVHLVTEGPLGWSALQAASQLRLPVVSDFRTNFHEYSRHYKVGWLRTSVMSYLRRFHNRTHGTMVATEQLRRELAMSGFRGLRVVPRGVDSRLFDPARRSNALRASWGAGPNTLVAIHVGRLAPEKNLSLVSEAYDAMREIDASIPLVFVGEGPCAAEVRRRSPTAILAGVRRGEELATYYASADVFLFPSVTETYGNVVPEAMASGLAVVAFDYAAAGQLVRHGVNGLIAPVGDVHAFRALAARLATEPGDALSLGIAARQTASRLDWSRIIEAIEAEYDTAILARERAPRAVRIASAEPVDSRVALAGTPASEMRGEQIVDDRGHLNGHTVRRVG